jgi:hypothetical protein
LTLISVGPAAHGTVAVVSDGTSRSIAYQPRAGFNGTDSFSYTIGAGVDPSNWATGTITVNVDPLNDPPTFTKGANQSVLDTNGPQAIEAWAKQISAGPPDEATQTVHFLVKSDNPSLFTTQPAVDGTGRLTFTPALNASGIANVTVVAVDDGGTASGGLDTSPPQTFTIGLSLAEPLHNRGIAADVTGDGNVVAEDAIDVINFIHAHGSGPVTPANPGDPRPALFYDVTGDDYVAADDVVTIINYINAHPTAQQEAEAPVAQNSANGAAIDSALLLILAGEYSGQALRRKA